MNIRLDPDRLAENFRLLAGTVREPWPPPVSSRVSSYSDGSGYVIIDEIHMFLDRNWHQAWEYCGRAQARAARRREMVEAIELASERNRAAGMFPSTAWVDYPASDPVEDIRRFYALMRAGIDPFPGP